MRKYLWLLLAIPLMMGAISGNMTDREYDKFQETTSGETSVRVKLSADSAGLCSDTAYGSSWDGVTTIAPSKNAVYDKIEALAPRATETKSDNYSVLTTDAGKTLVMDTAAKTFSLPSVSASNIGLWFTFVKTNTGSLIIDAADSDLINDSSAGGTIYDAQTNETYATIVVQLVSATQWVAYSGVGSWTTN